MMMNRSIGCALLGITLLAGCAQVDNNYTATARELMRLNRDVVKTPAQIAAIPYPAAYLTLGPLPRALVVQAFDEQGQNKWVSADRNLFVQQHGRWVKTIGLPSDLISISNLAQDPLVNPLAISAQGTTWSTTIYGATSLQSGRNLQMTLTRQGTEVIKVQDQPRTLVHIVEAVTAQPDNDHWKNEYWVNPQTGRIELSVQTLGPGLPKIVFQLLKAD